MKCQNLCFVLCLRVMLGQQQNWKGFSVKRSSFISSCPWNRRWLADFLGSHFLMAKNNSDSSLWVIGLRGMFTYSSGLNSLHSTWECCYDYFLLCFACVLLPPAMSVKPLQKLQVIVSVTLVLPHFKCFDFCWMQVPLCVCRIHSQFFALGLQNCHHHSFR